MLEKEVREAINRANAESNSNTPDHILAGYLMSCLEAFNDAVNDRDRWYGLAPKPGGGYGQDDLTRIASVLQAHGVEQTEGLIGDLLGLLRVARGDGGGGKA